MSNPHSVFPEMVVVVDDDENDQFLLKRLLAKAGIDSHIVVFSDGREAIQGLAQLAGNAAQMAILLDVKMPLADGFAVLRWLRSQPVFSAAPVIMLSSSDQPSDVAQAQRHGAQCYLVKHPADVLLDEVLRDARRYGVATESERKTLFVGSYNRLLS